MDTSPLVSFLINVFDKVFRYVVYKVADILLFESRILTSLFLSLPIFNSTLSHTHTHTHMNLTIIYSFVRCIACPSDKFQNCQDVTASIGIYLNALPLSTVSTGSSDNSIISNNNSNNDDDSDDNKNNKTTTNNNAVVDPSTMTEELIAFQNSFEAAIANNELQDAIREDYRQKNNDELSSAGPPVMIVTVNGLETIPPVAVIIDNDNDGNANNDGNSNNENENENENNEGNGGNINNNSDNDTETDTVVDDEADIGTEINTDNDNDVSSVSTGGLITDTGLPDPATSSSIGKPFGPTSSIAAEATGEDTINRDISMSTGGIVGTAIVSLLLVSVVAILAVVRRRTHNDRHGGWHGKKTKTKSNDKRRVNGDDDDCRDGSGYDLSEQNLLRNAYDSDDDYNNDGDVEDITGRTMRTAVSGSTTATATSHDLRALTMEGDEILVPVVATSSSSLSIMQPILEYNYEEEGKVVDNLVSRAVVVSDDLISFDEAPNDAKKEVNEKGNDEDESNDYVVGEDDDSHSSVGEQLLSASRSSELCIAASTSSELHNPDPSATTAVIEAAAVAITTTGIAAATDSIASPETRKETIDPSNNTLLRAGDFSSPRKLSHSTSFPSSSSMSSDGGSTVGMESIRPLSELDIAIANGDWAAVGATAALMATSIHDAPSPESRRNRQPSSASSVTSSDFSQKATELDRLIDAGDWQAVVVAAARYDAEGGSTIGGEDASRSCRSRTSTQEGSDANDTSSYASNTDYSMSMGRSVATSASQKERVQEIREQVTKLVLDTVPDEADNVDEMMNQFKGKEEELLETLRTMKERNVAKKARVESQKIARRNTRSRDKKEGFPSTAATATSTPSTTPDVGRLVNEGSGTEEHSEDILASNNSNDNDSMPQGSSSVTTDNDEETVETGYDSGKEYVGSFENATRVDPDTAAAAAAAWAIQRSLDNMMEKEEKGLK
jgi:hypothetical protein